MSFKYNAQSIYYLSKTHIKAIFEAYKVTNLEELRTALDFGVKAQIEDEKQKKIRLGNEKLQMEIDFLKLRVDYFKNFGVDISHSAREALKSAIYKKQNPQTQEINEKQWTQIYEILINVLENGMNQCAVCKDSFEKIETCKKHIIDNHELEMKKVAGEVLTW